MYLASGRGQRSSSRFSGEKTVSVLSLTSTGGGDMLLGLGGLSGGRFCSSVPSSSALGGRGGGGRLSSNMVCTKRNSNTGDIGCALNRTNSCYTVNIRSIHTGCRRMGSVGIFCTRLAYYMLTLNFHYATCKCTCTMYEEKGKQNPRKSIHFYAIGRTYLIRRS